MTASIHYLPVRHDLGDTPTREECTTGWNSVRPCRFTDCKHHLAVEVKRGHTTTATCALDEADRGGMTPVEVGEVLGITRARVDQIKRVALKKLAACVGSDWRNHPPSARNGALADALDTTPENTKYKPIGRTYHVVTGTASLDNKDRVYAVYEREIEEGRPCIVDPCCTLSAGHVPTCVVGLAVHMERERRQ